MLNRRLPLHGLLAVLLALVVQLGVGATVPRSDPGAIIAGDEAICHAQANGPGNTPDRPPTHPADCLVCPLCVALHAASATLVPPEVALSRTTVMVVLRSELPPPSTAPPSRHRPASQPRAPPTIS